MTQADFHRRESTLPVVWGHDTQLPSELLLWTMQTSMSITTAVWCMPWEKPENWPYKPLGKAKAQQNARFRVGDHVLIFEPGLKSVGMTILSVQEPYHVVAMYSNRTEVHLLDQHQASCLQPSEEIKNSQDHHTHKPQSNVQSTNTVTTDLNMIATVNPPIVQLMWLRQMRTSLPIMWAI